MSSPRRHIKNRVTVSGIWFPMPVDFLQSRICASLSPHAVKMFIDLCSQLKANGYGNGDLTAAPTVMRLRGWTSNETRQAAIAELIDAGVLSVTRQGGRRQCSLYALTLWPIQCPLDKLDHGPGSYTTQDWRKSLNGQAERLSEDAPARWAHARKKNTLPCPATGQPGEALTPPRAKHVCGRPVIDPATGSPPVDSGLRVGPPRATYLEKPSALPHCARVAQEPEEQEATS